MANRYWVGGSGTWDTTSTTNWSSSSGGASGASVPTAADSVFFDQASTYTITLSGILTCLDFSNTAGTVTFAGGGAVTASGAFVLTATAVWSNTSVITLNAPAAGTTAIDVKGVYIYGLTINGGTTHSFLVTSQLNVSTALTHTQGLFDTNNFPVNCANFTSSGAATRSLYFGSSNILVVGGGSTAFAIASTGLTFNAGTSQIYLGGPGSGIFSDGAIFYNVAFTANVAGTNSITGANTFNNLSVTAPVTAGVSALTFAANQTINGTLSTDLTAGNRRVFFASDTYGIGRTLTVNSAPSMTDADFRDLYVTGTAAPISGTRIGNRGNCSGITFSTPKTVYWNSGGSGGGNWSANFWAAASSGSQNTDNFPLPQDTAIIDNSGLLFSGTLTLDSGIGYIGTIDLSSRTDSMTLSIVSSNTVYGNWKSGSGTTISGTFTLTFSGGGTQTITSAGSTFSCPITVDTYGGTVQLADALNIGTNTLTVTNGTFNTAGFAVTANQLSSTNSNVRTISLGASVVTLTANGTALSCATATNLTLDAGTSQINCSGGPTLTIELASAAGPSFTLYNLTVTPTNMSSMLISGPITFNNLSITRTSATSILPCSFSSDIVVGGTLAISSGSAIRRVFLRSSAAGTQRDLTVGTLVADDCDFRDIEILGTASGTSPTRAGDCGNNSGITFPSPKTVYWNLTGAQSWAATAWCTSSGGTPAVNNFPLAQDTAVFDNAGSATTVTSTAAWNIGTFDASNRTVGMTFSTSTVTIVVYGDWKFGTGVASSSTTGAISFGKKGTQTITSNGVQFGCPISFSHPNGYVQLADAFSVGPTRTVTTNAGIFDAVTYNVTIGLFSGSSGSMVMMGSGTWTLSGTGSVWSIASTAVLFAGTSTIVLSNTSTTARSFSGAGFYYNKLTIGGTTGTSTLTISGANTFGELASTKTVAHTILFTSATTTNIGKWSVTGTSGNVVTVGPVTAASSYTFNINGPATTGINYLSISYCAVSTTSPGEFYVGANSTNTAGNSGLIFFTATPTPRTLYWVGGSGSWSSTAKWSTSSGGTSGAAIPTSLDSVVFNSASSATAYTVTMDVGVPIARCAAFTMAGPASGNVTWAGNVGIVFHGSVLFAATGITRTTTGNMNWAGNSNYTFTTNGLVLSTTLTVIGIGSTWTLGSNLDNGTKNITVTSGTLDTSTNNYAITCGGINSTNANVRAIKFNASTITGNQGTTITFTQPTNLIFDAGTSQINNGTSVSGFSGGGQTFYNVSFATTSTTGCVISGANTFNDFSLGTRPSLAVYPITFSANQTINGTLTLGSGASAAYRTFLASDTIGTPRTLTVNALAAGAADVDFRDITVTGSAAPLTGTRFGDCKGNSGITFDAAKTVYWSVGGSINWGNASAVWGLDSGGTTPDITVFPLAQDTAVFPATKPTTGGTIFLNIGYNIGTIDMSLKTSNTMTLATGTTTPAIYGNWINGTGTTLSGTGVMTFAGRGSQTIRSSSKTFTQPIYVNTPSGSVTLQDSLVCNASAAPAIQLIAGTLAANGYNVTMSGSASAFSSSNSNTRTIAIGAGTWTVLGSGTTWTTLTSTNLTVTGTGTISLINTGSKTFAGGGVSYSGITLNQGGTGQLSITGNNFFANITNTSGSATTINLTNTIQTVGTWTAKGTAGNLLTITGTSAASPATLIYSGGGVISSVDYVVPTSVRVFPPTSKWYAGANSTNGGTLGWIFAPYVPPTSGINGQFFAFF